MLTLVCHQSSKYVGASKTFLRSRPHEQTDCEHHDLHPHRTAVHANNGAECCQKACDQSLAGSACPRQTVDRNVGDSPTAIHARESPTLQEPKPAPHRAYQRWRTKVRIKISNTFGDHPLLIGGAHIARRTAAADIDPTSDRTLMFHGRSSTTVPARSMVVSYPAELDVPALSDLAISLFLPKTTEATTLHILAMQTSYVSSDTGDSTADVKFPVGKTIQSWPFLTGVDVAASAHGAAIVAFGSSLTDGDGSTLDTNRRWPDVLAERLQKGADGMTEVGVLNQGIIGNRLLDDSPRRARSPFGAALGQAGLARFKRDVLAQAGVGYVIVGLGINDIVFPGSLTPLTERMNAESMISGLRRTPRTSVKMAALAPMPSASVSTTVTASPWVRASERTATLRSLTNDIILLFLPGSPFSKRWKQP